ncbi:hypothetical protein KJ575_00215 [Patescibacteria group bacterium]|nr:hypothetical protein [Patescibacteria group bacterium]MBU4368130.1 hypothetical protein [Patescibacteria group bacterium]
MALENSLIDKSVVDSFTTSDLVRGIKTSAAFAKFNLDWDAIYEINNFDRDSYVAGSVLE